jgi:hypothetical protein
MNTADTNGRKSAGTALCTVLLLIMTMSAAVAVMCSISTHRSWKATRLAYRARALALAEAGVHQAYSVLVTNFNASTNAEVFPETTYNGGTYDVEVTRVDDDTAVLHSEATYRGVSRDVMLDIRRDNGGGGTNSTPGHPAYGYSIIADGTITWTGCGQFLGQGIAHANDQFTQSGCGELNADCYSCVKIRLNGNSGFIDGDCYAPVINGKTSKIRGTMYKQPVAVVPIPDIDLTPYYNHALDNGEVYVGTKMITSDYAPDGGVMWVEGNLKISSHADVEGCFIATGYVKISSSGQHTGVADYPAFVSRDSYIKITSQFDAQGLFYTKVGNIEFAGGGSIAGSIVSGGNFKKSGNSTVFDYQDSTPVPPGAGGTPGDEVVCVTAWQK